MVLSQSEGRPPADLSADARALPIAASRKDQTRRLRRPADWWPSPLRERRSRDDAAFKVETSNLCGQSSCAAGYGVRRTEFADLSWSAYR